MGTSLEKIFAREVAIHANIGREAMVKIVNDHFAPPKEESKKSKGEEVKEK